MNLVELLANELRNKHLTDFEKVRYIYLRCCEIFSFDTRWHYPQFFEDKDFKQKLIDKKFDIENIDNYLVVCHSFAKELLKPLIEELTDLEIGLEMGKHTIATLDYGPEKWELDATIGDLTRVKAKLVTNGFTAYSSKYNKRLEETDEIIGYKTYSKTYFIEKMNVENDTTKIESIAKLLLNSNCKYHYADASFYYKMFLKELNINQIDTTCMNSNQQFNKLIKLINEDKYFNLYKKRTVYSVNQIDKEEYEELKRTLRHKKG